MNINTSGIVNKLSKHADILAFIASGYYRFDGDFGGIIKNYTSKDFLQNLKFTLKNPKYSLWDSDHLYTMLFKGGVFAYLAAELGIIAPKYKAIAKKVMTGAGIAAMTLPGSHDARSSSSGGSSGSGGGW